MVPLTARPAPTARFRIPSTLSVLPLTAHTRTQLRLAQTVSSLQHFYPFTIVPEADIHAQIVDYINTLLASGAASARPTTLVTITASLSSAPAVATPTGTAADDDDYCDDEPTVTSSVSSRPTASAAAATDDEGDYCEEEETMTVSVTSRPTATAAAVADDGDDYCED